MGRDTTTIFGLRKTLTIRQDLDNIDQIVEEAFRIHKLGYPYRLTKDLHPVQTQQIMTLLDKKLQAWYAEEAEKSKARVKEKEEADAAAGIKPENSIWDQWS